MALKVADLLVVISGDPKGFERATERVSKNIQVIGKKMQAMGKMATLRVSLPLAAIGTAAGKMAMDFDDAMTRIISLVGVQRTQVEAWKRDILGISDATGRMSKELAEGMFFITSAGLRGKAALSALEQSAKAAAIGLGDTKSVAFATVSAMNAYGMGAEDAERAVATLMMTVREGNLEAATLAPTLGRVLPIASQLGVSFDQVGAAYAAMTRLGVNAEESATGLRATMVGLLKPAEGAKKAMADLGLSAEGLRRQVREEGLLSVLFTLKEAMGDNEAAMAKVFPNVRALTAVLNLVGKNSKETQRIFSSLAKTTGKDLADAFKIAEESSKVKFQKAMAGLNAALVRLGEEILPAVLPAITAVADAIATGAAALGKMDPVLQSFVLGLGAIAIAGGPALMLLGAIIASSNQLVAAITRVSGAMATSTTTTAAAATTLRSFNVASAQAATGVRGLNAAIAASPIGMLTLMVSLIPLAWQAGKKLAGTYGEIKSPLDEFTRSLTKNKEEFLFHLEQFNRQKKALGLSGEAWRVNSEHTVDNAARLAELTTKVNEHIRARMAQKDVEEEMSAADREKQKRMDAAMQYLLNQKKAIDDTTQALREKYSVVTKKDVMDALAAQVKDYEKLKELGIDLGEGAGDFGQQLLENLENVKRYKVPLGELPHGVREMAAALSQQVGPELQKQLDAISMFGTQYETLAPKIMVGITDAAGQIKESLSGGFGQGVAEGIAFGDQQLRTWVQEVAGIEVPITIAIDDARFLQWVDDLVNGRIPPGGGATP